MLLTLQFDLDILISARGNNFYVAHDWSEDVVLFPYFCGRFLCCPLVLSVLGNVLLSSIFLSNLQL